MENMELLDINACDLVMNANLSTQEIESLIEDISNEDIVSSISMQNLYADFSGNDSSDTSESSNAMQTKTRQRHQPYDWFRYFENNLPTNACNSHICVYCFVQFSQKEALDMHLSAFHGISDGSEETEVPVVSFESYTVSRLFNSSTFGNAISSIHALFECLRVQISQDISAGLKLFPRIGVKFCLQSTFQKDSFTEAGECKVRKMLESSIYKVLSESQIDKTIEIASDEVESIMEAFFRDVPNCVLVDVKSLRISIQKYKSLCDGKYMPLPYLLWKRREIFINVDNSKETFENESLTHSQQRLKTEDDLNSSFLFAVAAGIKNAKYCTESMKTYRKTIKRLNLNGIVMPMTLDQLPKFERQNPFIEISVFGFYDTGINEENHPDLFPQRGECGDVSQRLKKSMTRCGARDKIISKYSFPLYISGGAEQRKKYMASHTSGRRKQNKDLIKIDLFLIIQKQKEGMEAHGSLNIMEHYVLCKDIGALFRYSNRCKSYLCRYCLQRFKKPETLASHVDRCTQSKKQMK